MAGIFGTRASLLSDLLLASLLLLIPLFLSGYIFARRKRGSTHRMIMVATYGVVAVFVLIYIIHNFVDGFPPGRGGALSSYNVIYLSTGLIHSLFATLALIMGGYQLYTGYSFTSGKRGWSMDAKKRQRHQANGNRVLIYFSLTAATGIFFYYWVFISP